jgi:catechol 2,3-dioxygenase-like lactoylglutathione lyase family enzyme
MPLAHLTLATRDVAAAAAFFSRALGWQPVARPNNIGRPAAWLRIAPGQELHLVEVADFQASPFEAEFGRHVALAFPRADFEALKRRLLEQGAKLIEPERPTPFARFFFRDRDGYVFEVVPEERDAEDGGVGALASRRSDG